MERAQYQMTILLLLLLLLLLSLLCKKSPKMVKMIGIGVGKTS